MALVGKNAIMPIIVREQSPIYHWTIGEAPLEKIANVEKKMPRHYITEDGFGITAACRSYLSPLIQGEDYPSYRHGLPIYAKLKNIAVEKKLNTSFDLVIS